MSSPRPTREYAIAASIQIAPAATIIGMDFRSAKKSSAITNAYATAKMATQTMPTPVPVRSIVGTSIIVLWGDAAAQAASRASERSDPRGDRAPVHDIPPALHVVGAPVLIQQVV